MGEECNLETIIKALQTCANAHEFFNECSIFCQHCSYRSENSTENCTAKLFDDVINFLSRIDRSLTALDKEDEIKMAAYKEFADRIRQFGKITFGKDNQWEALPTYVIDECLIEMTGGKYR